MFSVLCGPPILHTSLFVVHLGSMVIYFDDNHKWNGTVLRGSFENSMLTL